MGQTSSAPSDRWPYFLIFDTDKLSNNVITCNELGIRYRLHTPPRTHIFSDDRVTSVYRWDRESQQEIHVAEVEKRRHSQRVRIAPRIGLDALGPDVPSMPMHIKLTNGCIDILDELVVTCLIAEKKRREQRSSSSAAAAGGGAAAASGGGGC
ncbi:hypothetical protein ACEPAF_7090 [Sanghuangporus sanghuang]